MKVSIFTIISANILWQGSAIPLDLLQSLGKMKSTESHQRESNWERRATNEPGECRLPKEENDEDLLKSDTNSARNSKALKICDVLGGLDVTRVYSHDTRSLFQGAIDDVELMREYMSEAIINGAREFAPVLNDLATSLDFEARNLTMNDTTVTAGLAWVDDRIDRRMDRYVSESKNLPHTGDKVCLFDVLLTCHTHLPSCSPKCTFIRPLMRL